MTAAIQPDPDGDLIGARRRLGDAVSRLIDPQPQLHQEQTVWLDSLYQQLWDALPGEQREGSRGAQSEAPLWIDAVDLKAEIDTAVSVWLSKPVIDLRDGDPPPLTVLRLQQLEDKGWRPQDVKAIEQIVGILEQWARNIKTLLNPLPKWTLPNPCPACGKAVVYRRDGGGDLVKTPALSVSATEGCRCLACRTYWAPDRFVFLARVLGSLPEGVLE